MLISIATHGIEVNNRLRKRIEYRARFAVMRFESHLREFAVHLEDENGPRGGVDTICRLTATLHDGGTIRIKEKHTNLMGAISRAAKRFRNVISRRMGRRETNRGIIPSTATEIWIG
ncbi:MAG TPA: HPF/RaiA family ribosome-associated protein [Bryobacteraceae bacterium]|jgi:ribosome-associated translation inhibitor RaiA